MSPASNSSIKIALVGNPNSGKSTLFNALTGLHQKTGNFAGVTVDRKVGEFNLNESASATIVDLPGTYSLYPKTLDEHVAVEVLVDDANPDKPDVILCVADATNLKRSLYLCTQLIDIKIPVILCLNMFDLLAESGKTIDINELKNSLGIEVISVIARDQKGFEELKLAILKSKVSDKTIFKLSQVHHNFLKENKYKPVSTYKDWLKQVYKIDAHEDESFKKIHLDEITERYHIIRGIIEKSVIIKEPDKIELTNKLDNILTHPLWGYLIFMFVMFLVFQSVFSFSAFPMDFIETTFAQFSQVVKNWLPDGIFSDLLINGILAGLSGIIIFIPQIAFLFAFLAILEDSGYMARVSLLTDRILRVFGLNGKSIISLLSGVACAVPAIMGTRTISNYKERLITILITPLISCSARLPVFTLIISIAFPVKYYFGVISLQALILLALYSSGFIMALLVALILKRFIKTRERSFFIMEMPVYRWPRTKNILLTIWEKVRVFVGEAGKVIMVISLLLWILSSFGPDFDKIEAKYNQADLRAQYDEPALNQMKATEKLENSYAGLLGKSIEPLIKPLGYDWKIGIALITSFAAREVFVGTMATLYSVGDDSNTETLRNKISKEVNPTTGEKVFNTATSVSLMLFYLFALQCMSTIAVVYRETKTYKWPVFMFIYMGGLAYLAGFIAYQLLK